MVSDNLLHYISTILSELKTRFTGTVEFINFSAIKLFSSLDGARIIYL